MPKATRSRTIDAGVPEVWKVVSDPYHLPRWWPRVDRVENVRGEPAAKRTQWTVVFGTRRGRGIRADYRCVGATREERYAWEQQLEDTPFARHLQRSTTEIALVQEGAGTGIEIHGEQKFRGLSRLGSFFARGALRRQLDEALAGLDEVIAGGTE